MPENVTHHRDGTITVEVPMSGGLRSETRLGLSEEGWLQVRSVCVITDDPATNPITSPRLREVPLSRAYALAAQDERFFGEAQRRAAATHAERDKEQVLEPVGKGATYTNDDLRQVARCFLQALRTRPRSAVLETGRLLAGEGVNLSPSRIRDRLRAAYERGILVKLNNPGKAAAVPGPRFKED